MSAVEAKSTPDTYFINGKNLSGAKGALFGRVRSPSDGTLVQLERLATRLTFSATHYEDLHGPFSRKEVVIFEIHRGVRVLLSVPAVVSEMVKKGDIVAALLEYELG